MEPGNFHILIINDNIDKAYMELRDFIGKNMDNAVEGNSLSLF